jgi:prevent-host-death family protein
MSEVTRHDLQDHGDEVLDGVAAGERITVTRDGRPVALLHPTTRPTVPVDQLLERWRRLAPVDPAGLREDIDAIFDTRL